MKHVLHLRKYTDKNGVERTWSTRIGAAFPTKNGNERITIDYLPAGLTGPLELVVAGDLPKSAD